MTRDNVNAGVGMGVVLEGEGREELEQVDASESYQSAVRTRSILQTGAPVEAPTAKESVVPAWIKTQLEQLEVRRKARHRVERAALADVQKID